MNRHWIPRGSGREIGGGLGLQVRSRLRGLLQGVRVDFGPGLGRQGRFAQDLGLLLGREAGALPGGAAARLDHHFLDQAVEGRIQRFAPAIEQFQLHGVAAAMESLQPEGGLAVNQKTVAVHAHPQPPAAVVVLEVLEGGIE